MSEEQALDRIHRLGQTKEVTTVRYIINNRATPLAVFPYYASGVARLVVLMTEKQ